MSREGHFRKSSYVNKNGKKHQGRRQTSEKRLQPIPLNSNFVDCSVTIVKVIQEGLVSRYSEETEKLKKPE